MPTVTHTGDYLSEWTQVDTFDAQGLPKSALEKVESILTRARADRNSDQVLKALIFRGKYQVLLEEDGLTKAIQGLENEIGTTAQPEKSVLQSMVAELYATYLQSKGWQIRNRTPIPDGEGGDILTWSAAQIEKHALDLYGKSVAEEALLRGTPVENFKDILTPGRGDTATAALRPTLFDFLAQRAVNHFSNERSYLTQPAYKFYLDQPEAFAKASDFVRAKFDSKDMTSGKWLAINLFQKLTASHLNDSDPSALIDLELQRLAFTHGNSVLDVKTERYLSALEALHGQYQNHVSGAEIAWAWATQLSQSEGEKRAENLKRAVVIAEEAIRRHPNSYGAKQCANLLNFIRANNLSLSAEQAYLPEKPLLFQVSFKNLKKIWVKVVSSANVADPLENVEWERRVETVVAMPEVQKREWTLPDPGDYIDHSTELALEALPAGRYFVVVADNADFSKSKGTVLFAPFNCTQLAPAHFQENGKTKLVIAQREFGNPLPGVKADFYTYIYNARTGGNDRQLHSSAVSDAKGMIVPNFAPHTGYQVRLTMAEDTFWLMTNIGDYEVPRPAGYRQAEFFTDRSIYRPGQTVYFKAIVLDRNPEQMPSIVPNLPVKAKLIDVNDQEKSSISLKTNEFGTVNGAFQAPASGLTGTMRIEIEGANGAAYFNVEEYKRPKFEVTFKPVKGSYRLNETVTVRGEAKSYAGSVVDGAQLSYRVVRQARFPWWKYAGEGGWHAFPPTEKTEIANGTATTGTDGSFEIKFTALPDRSIPKKDQPMFDFTVTADVTDVNGETRSAEQSLSVGYVALNVDFGLGESVELDSLRSISIKTSNTAGQFQPASGEVVITRLVEPGRIFNQRYWPDPDLWTLEEGFFRKNFPNYAWKGEEKPEKWGRQDFSRPVAFNTADSKTLDLSGAKLQPGWYEIVLRTKDAFGEPIEIKRVTQVWSRSDRRTQFREPKIFFEKSSAEPGEKVALWLGAKGDGWNFFVSSERRSGIAEPQWLMAKGAEKIDFSLLENDRGTVLAHAFAVRNNRFYGGLMGYLFVPWSNKELKISFETFRDKLQPGSQEEWRLKISGPKKEKVAAELVAAMYDASLDQFLGHGWNGIGFPTRSQQLFWRGADGFGLVYGEQYRDYYDESTPWQSREYQQLNWFDFPFHGNEMFYAMKAMRVSDSAVEVMAAPSMAGEEMMKVEAQGSASMPPPELTAAGGGVAKTQAAPPAGIRRNLQETVFFYPDLRTDAEGNVILKFKMNEALTRWKLLAFAHTKDLQNAVATKEVVTQKELMILANPPRFMREGDEIEFSAKISNLTQAAMTGTARLNLLDAVNLSPIEKDFGLTQGWGETYFSVPAGQSTVVAWRLRVPTGKTNAVTWQIFAEGKSPDNMHRDGEESTLPVVTNRMLVTEALPISLRGGQTKTFVFESFKNKTSTTMTTHRYSLEFSSNPAWYAVQALPYLMEYPHECSEQIFSRFYANTLASTVANRLPNIRRIYDKWKGTEAMKSNLSKNQELKYALLEETPWVLDAQSEEQQKQNIALLFDLNRMADEREKALRTLAERQSESGGWAWFPGGREDWYITQHILAGLAHLEKLGALDLQNDQTTQPMVDKALGFCDRKLREQYAEIERAVAQKKAKWEDDHLDGMAIHYLYTRSFFGKMDRLDKVTAFYLDQAQKFWLGKGLYQEGMLALAMHRFGMKDPAMKIVNSLRERAIVKEELGMYWAYDYGFYWYQLPVETQALMVEVFNDVAADKKAVEELRIWLLKNKQTNHWESTKATSEAVYALLLGGENWLENNRPVSVSLGGKTLQPAEYEAGTGYFKEQWSGAEVKPSWSQIRVENPNSNIVWGAAYWQYFENLDKITSFKKTPLTMVKQLFREEDSPTGKVLKPIAAGASLQRGDKLKVRLEIRVDRPMEYVHIKDMRASGFEPINVLSQYRWQGGLGYYESTKDLATHFFVDYLPRGTFVFEYPLVVSQKGDFSNGITTIQCMYAPEFTSHSEGIRVGVK